MLKFSANLGFLWDSVELPKRIEHARAAGFDAVECHFPYEFPAERIASASANQWAKHGRNQHSFK